MADSPLSKDEALETLRILGRLGVPLWLAGGLAADFHVGRWTREHEDIDLVEGVRLRVISVEDEWVFATGYTAFRPGARPRPTVAHNLALLESLLTEEDRERLRPLAGRRLPLAGGVGGRRSVAERPPTGDKFDAR